MSTIRTLIGFYGPGSSTKANTFDLLDDWLSNHPWDITVVIPAQHDAGDGMKTVYDWIMEGDTPIENVVLTGEDDLPESYFEEDLADERDDVSFWEVFRDEAADALYNQRFLVVLWGEDGDDETEALLQQAKADPNDIRCLDLTSGLDVIVLAPKKDVEKPAPAKKAPAKKAPAKALPHDQGEEDWGKVRPAAEIREEIEREEAQARSASTVEEDPVDLPETKLRGKPREQAKKATPGHRDTVTVEVDPSGQIIGLRGRGRPSTSLFGLVIDTDKWLELKQFLGLE